ncbi:MFS transporter [Pseudomonas sp. RP23018S]|uniref:MFS transporter n=1 Tax=Pseudomonas sp. RP23018S TaxID=3096037 RepID=UPI002ACAE2E0|nr:MFS transporter [Pseudomonas sp. RP23018S]MDZ5601185.1 MFS transporter [Pseudomonas sp. RP23018S]
MEAQQDATRRALVLCAVCMAGLILPLEYTGPAMALSAIGDDLGGSSLALAWVVNAFALSFGSAIMAAGTLADLYGRKRLFCWGIGSFTLLSVVVSCAPNVVFLDLIRGLQGIAAALTMAGGSATLAQEYQGHARTRAFGLLGTAFGLGLAFGPVVSGMLVECFNWRAIFLLGAAFGALAWWLAAPRMVESRDPDARHLDWAGVLSFTAMLVLLTFAIMHVPAAGWRSLTVMGLLAAAVLMLALFIGIERRQARPMLDLSLFADKRFVGVQLLPIATALSFIVLLILLPLRLVGVEQLSAGQAGLMMMGLSLPMLLVPFLAALMARHIASANLCFAGLLLAGIGLLWLARIEVGADWLALCLPLLLIGIGSAMPWGLMDDLSIKVVSVERAGMATGIFTTMRACGEAICVAAALAVLNSLLQQPLDAVLAEGSAKAVAGELATGSFAAAQANAHPLSGPALMGFYGNAFATLTYGLAALTLAAAVVSRWALREPVAPCPAPAAPRAPR